MSSCRLLPLHHRHCVEQCPPRTPSRAGNVLGAGSPAGQNPSESLIKKQFPKASEFLGCTQDPDTILLHTPAPCSRLAFPSSKIATDCVAQHVGVAQLSFCSSWKPISRALFGMDESDHVPGETYHSETVQARNVHVEHVLYISSVDRKRLTVPPRQSVTSEDSRLE